MLHIYRRSSEPRYMKFNEETVFERDERYPELLALFDDPKAEEWDWINDFNYVGSRHHY